MFCKRQQATGAGALETRRSSLSGVTDGIEQHNVTDLSTRLAEPLLIFRSERDRVCEGNRKGAEQKVEAGDGNRNSDEVG
jgi:hypothetical protein